MIEKFATTPYGDDPEVDEILSNTILVCNVIQNPDGRVFGTRENANGFDLNRDYMTQSQPETLASIKWMKRWLAPEMLDLHGYVTPTLIEATTKPHNPSIEYDMWLKWNQPRIDYNEAALDEIGQDVTRPINEWCPEADEAGPDGICDDGSTPGPDVAEGWDDWGPFYAPMYHQHIGLDSSTVEMCRRRTRAAGAPGRRRDPERRPGVDVRVRRGEPRGDARATSSRSTAAVTSTPRARSAARTRSSPSSTTGCSTTRRPT